MSEQRYFQMPFHKCTGYRCTNRWCMKLLPTCMQSALETGMRRSTGYNKQAGGHIPCSVSCKNILTQGSWRQACMAQIARAPLEGEVETCEDARGRAWRPRHDQLVLPLVHAERTTAVVRERDGTASGSEGRTFVELGVLFAVTMLNLFIVKKFVPALRTFLAQWDDKNAPKALISQLQMSQINIYTPFIAGTWYRMVNLELMGVSIQRSQVVVLESVFLRFLRANFWDTHRKNWK